MERDNRLFEFRGLWLARRPGSSNLYICWYERRPGARWISRKSTGETNLERAKERLIEFLATRSSPQAESAIRVPVQVQRPAAVASPIASRNSTSPLLLDVLADYIEAIRSKPSFESRLPTFKWWTAFSEIDTVVYVSDLTLDVQERYIAWRRKQLLAKGFTASNGTLIKEFGVLSAALHRAKHCGKLTDIPRLIRLQQPPPRDRYLSEDEVRRLLNTPCVPHLRYFIYLSLHTLARPSALFLLRKEQVNLERQFINLLPEGAVQSNKRKPIVPISSTLAGVLNEAMDKSRSGYIIEWENAPVRSLKKAFAKHCERAGITNCTPYTLRHTGATWLAAKGVPMRQIAGLMGISERTAERVYAKHSPTFMAGAARVLDELFSSPPTIESEKDSALPSQPLRIVDGRNFAGQLACNWPAESTSLCRPTPSLQVANDTDLEHSTPIFCLSDKGLLSYETGLRVYSSAGEHFLHTSPGTTKKTPMK